MGKIGTGGGRRGLVGERSPEIVDFSIAFSAKNSKR
jgi:hypothetical protein